MPYIKRQTRVSTVPEKSVSSIIEGVGMLSFGSKVTEKEGLRLMNGDEYLDRRKTILHL